jgi:hypothetical protein
LYTKGKCSNQDIQLIIDTGAAKNMVSSAFLKRIKRKIDEKSNARCPASATIPWTVLMTYNLSSKQFQ